MHLLTDEAASQSRSSLLHAEQGQPSAGGGGSKTSTVTASLDGVSCLNGRSTSKGDAAAAVESSQGGVRTAEGETALASSNDALFDKPVVLQDREGSNTEHSKPDEEALRTAVIYVGEDVTAQRLVVCVIPLFDVSYHYIGGFVAALLLCGACVCGDIREVAAKSTAESCHMRSEARGQPRDGAYLLPLLCLI